MFSFSTHIILLLCTSDAVGVYIVCGLRNGSFIFQMSIWLPPRPPPKKKPLCSSDSNFFQDFLFIFHWTAFSCAYLLFYFRHFMEFLCRNGPVVCLANWISERGGSVALANFCDTNTSNVTSFKLTMV